MSSSTSITGRRKARVLIEDILEEHGYWSPEEMDEMTERMRRKLTRTLEMTHRVLSSAVIT